MIETGAGLVCPGWCGYVNDHPNPDIRVALFNTHVAHCARGQRSLELMRQYTEWLMDEVSRVNDLLESEMNYPEIARRLVTDFTEHMPFAVAAAADEEG